MWIEILKPPQASSLMDNSKLGAKISILAILAKTRCFSLIGVVLHYQQRIAHSPSVVTRPRKAPGKTA
jgi:hypothetical protein